MNDKQRAIMELQEALRDISKVEDDMPVLIPDGIFGEKTEAVVKTFQRKSGFEETGTVDFDLWEKIMSERKRALFILSDPKGVVPIKKERLPLTLGQKGSEVQTLNMMLSQLGELYSNFRIVGSGDEFTLDTEREVKNWQRVINHSVTGEVDKFTWNMLSEHYLLPSKWEKEAGSGAD